MDICEALAASLYAPTLSSDIVVQWLAGQLPARQYTKPYAPPARLAIGTKRAREPVKIETGSEKKVQFFDLLEQVASGEATTMVSADADGTRKFVTTDVGADSVAQLQAACYDSAGLASDIMASHIFGDQPPATSLVATLSRLFVVLLFEPVRFSFALEYTRPPTADVQLALRRATAGTEEDRLYGERMLQTYLTSYTANWFSDVAELGLSYRFLNPAALAVIHRLVERPELFADAELGSMGVSYRRFRYNARLAKHFDRGQLIGAFCCSFVNLRGHDSGTFTREVCIAGIEHALGVGLGIVKTPAGAQLTTRDAVVQACERARSILCALEIVEPTCSDVELTPADQRAKIVQLVQERFNK